jgi:BirA family transcriptional regulator, biotin operon repressor / biotin---[acetyl-CoA-carboxylase] ligase
LLTSIEYVFCFLGEKLQQLPSNSKRENSLRRKLSTLSLVRLKDLNPVCLTSVDSTQDYLIKSLQSKKEGDFVVGDIQTKGRGREGRIWHSDIGGLYLSITLVPKRTEIMDKIAPIVTKAIMDTLETDFRLSGCARKPPNDVTCHEKKIAGVLVDAEVKGENAIAYTGIGVDLNNGENWEEEMRKIATSYFLETGGKVDLDDFIVNLLERLDKAYNETLGKI